MSGTIAHRLRIALLTTCMLLVPVTGGAAILSFDFTADVSDFEDMGSIPGVGIGTQISGRYVFDGATPQTPDAPGVGLYRSAMRFFARVELPSGTALAVTPPNHFPQLTEIRTNDFALNMSEDESYRAGMELLPAMAGELTGFVVMLSSPTDTPEIDGTALPQTPPDISAFTTAQVAIAFPDGSNLTADLLTLPEPATGASAVAVMLSLGWIGRRRRVRPL